jgi:hypothetical protein
MDWAILRRWRHGRVRNLCGAHCGRTLLSCAGCSTLHRKIFAPEYNELAHSLEMRCWAIYHVIAAAVVCLADVVARRSAKLGGAAGPCTPHAPGWRRHDAGTIGLGDRKAAG